MILFKNKGNHRNEARHEKSGFELSFLQSEFYSIESTEPGMLHKTRLPIYTDETENLGQKEISVCKICG